MPIIEYSRFWCSQCQEFTVQHRGEEGSCTICGTITKEYKLSEIPIEKIQEQRQRYKNAQLRRYGDYLKFIKPRDMMEELFSEVGSNIRVIEDDAGQREIDQNHRNEYDRQVAQFKEKQQEYDLHYRYVGRNEKCPCGSEKKYKKCCYEKFRNCK